jgi:transcriptional regulator with XRE-family HTH domain
MPTVETRVSRKAVNDGDRQLRRTSTRFGEEVREIRLRAGVSQSAVAQTIDVSRSVICRIEQGDPNVSSRIRARVAAALGAEFRIAVYPSNAPLIHDAAHARIIERVLRQRHPTWRPTVEATVPGPGRRSTDLRMDRASDVVLMEVETRIGAFEAILRELAEKRRAVAELTPGKRTHVVLVLPPTRHHRDLVASHPSIVAAAFPAPEEKLVRALESADAEWPGDGILWIDAAPEPTKRSRAVETG